MAGQNLGYVLGYYGRETREQWYGCLSSEEAFETGRRMATDAVDSQPGDSS